MALTQVTKEVLHNDQANITIIGTLSNLTVSGNATVGNIIATSFTYANGVSILSDLYSNAAVQAGNIATLFANAGAQSESISTLTANAGSQAGTLATIQSSYAPLAGATFTGNISTTANVKFTGWHIYELSNTLYFAYNGNVKMSLNTSGNLTVTGDVAGFGTP